MTILQIILCGLAGSISAQILEYFQASRQNRSFSFLWAMAVTLVSTGWTIIYFSYFNPAIGQETKFLLVANYAMFVSLAVESITSIYTRGAPQDSELGLAAGVASLPASSGLVLNGFWQVFGVGAFGAFLAELLVLYKSRTGAKKYSAFYYLVTLAMILSGGGLTAIYGITNVSAPLAVQIGASAPLIVSRFRK